jgi:hypothetical protein
VLIVTDSYVMSHDMTHAYLHYIAYCFLSVAGTLHCMHTGYYVFPCYSRAEIAYK